MLARRPDFIFAPPRWTAWLAVVVVASVHAFAAWGGRGPVIVPDETGALGTAHVLSQTSPTWTLAGSGYMPGLGILLTPLWWITSDPLAVFYGALGVGVVLATLLVWPLARILRHFGATPTGAVVIAAVVAVAPARTVQSNYLVAEGLLALTTALAIVAAISYVGDPSHRAAVILGIGASLPFLAHGRGLAVSGAVAVWILLRARRSWATAATALVTLALGLAAWYGLYVWVASQLYWNDNRVSNSLAGLSGTAQEMLANLWGMSWYAVAAWPALVAAALIVLLSRALRDPVSLLVLGVGAAALLMAVIALSDPDTSVARLDAYIYGRYVDHVLAVLAAIGLALLVRIRSGALALASLAVVAFVVSMFHVFTVPVIPVGGRWTEIHVAGVAHYLSRFNYANDIAEPWGLLSMATVGLTLCVLALATVRSTVVWVLGLYMSGLSIADDALRVDPWDDSHRSMDTVIESTAAQDPTLPVTFDAAYARVINMYSFALNPREVRVAYNDAVPEDTVYFYSAWENSQAETAGAIPMGTPDVSTLAIWVYPGAEQERLAALGLLASRVDETDAASVDAEP